MSTRKTRRVIAYFSVWLFLALVCIVLNALNVEWDTGEETCIRVSQPDIFPIAAAPSDSNSTPITLEIIREVSGMATPPSVWTDDTFSTNADAVSSSWRIVYTTDRSSNAFLPFSNETVNKTQDDFRESSSSSSYTSQESYNNVSQAYEEDKNLSWASECTKTDKTHIAQGIFLVLLLGIIQGFVLEIPIQTLTTLIVGGGKRRVKMAMATGLSVVLNYNLLAVEREDVDECLANMHEAFLGNLCPEVSAVLVSATNDQDLKQYELQIRDKYRGLIYETLFREGLNFAAGHLEFIDSLRLKHLWERYAQMDKNLLTQQFLREVCQKISQEFMVLHRVSRVLRKCGQYQDLMLLSEGEREAYTYTEPAYYGRQARPYGEPLFHPSPDVDNVINRKFDYTLVLDGDTGVMKGSVFELLQVAAAHQDRGIIQPAIRLQCSDKDATLFMHLEVVRHQMHEPVSNAMMALLGQSSYFGKALIKNSIYIRNVIGTRDSLIERVPVDVLSHDTFEAALLRPLYCSTVTLLESPAYNYVSWNIRERRWNRGEVPLALYFWPRTLGLVMRFLQSKIQGEKFNATRLRTQSKLHFVASYVAHSALRQMIMKPLLLLYIIVMYKSVLRYSWASIVIVMFFLLVFPKLATCNRRNVHLVFIETLASFLQFTPEALVGCVRIVRAVHANLVVQAKWVPQRAVENQFKRSNPLLSSLQHLWGYSVVALVVGVLVAVFLRDGLLIMAMAITLLFLPLYTGVTSLNKDLKSSRAAAASRGQVVQASQIPAVTLSDPKSQFVKAAPHFVPTFDNLGFESDTISSKNHAVSERLGQIRPETLTKQLYPTLPVTDTELLENAHAQTTQSTRDSDSGAAGDPPVLASHDVRTQCKPPATPEPCSFPVFSSIPSQSLASHDGATQAYSFPILPPIRSRSFATPDAKRPNNTRIFGRSRHGFRAKAFSLWSFHTNRNLSLPFAHSTHYLSHL